RVASTARLDPCSAFAASSGEISSSPDSATPASPRGDFSSGAELVAGASAMAELSELLDSVAPHAASRMSADTRSATTCEKFLRRYMALVSGAPTCHCPGLCRPGH